MQFVIHEKYMRIALEAAKDAYKSGEIPVGCVIVSDDKIIAIGCNSSERSGLASRHAEIEALEKAATLLGTKNLGNCTLYTTLEPCGMCSGAIANYHVGTVVFGAYDNEFGCVFSKINLPRIMGQNVQCIGGILEDECKRFLHSFFLSIR